MIKTVLASLSLCLWASIVSATPITLPPDLEGGSIYYLAFVTAGTRDATSTEIGDYDAFVTAEAQRDPTLALLETTWKVLGSTATVDAITHLSATGPVYNLAGQLVTLDLFVYQTLLAPIIYNQFGDSTNRGVWTGTNMDGTSHYRADGFRSLELGSTSTVSAGSSIAPKFAHWIGGDDWEPTRLASLYGVSGPLTTPTSVPEPGTLSLVLVACALLRWRYGDADW